MYAAKKEVTHLCECDSISREQWKLFILHSLISTEEQQSIFMHVEDGRKIILSTNIAESSITVPDVEFGKMTCFIV